LRVQKLLGQNGMLHGYIIPFLHLDVGMDGKLLFSGIEFIVRLQMLQGIAESEFAPVRTNFELIFKLIDYIIYNTVLQYQAKFLFKKATIGK